MAILEPIFVVFLLAVVLWALLRCSDAVPHVSNGWKAVYYVELFIVGIAMGYNLCEVVRILI